MNLVLTLGWVFFIYKDENANTYLLKQESIFLQNWDWVRISMPTNMWILLCDLQSNIIWYPRTELKLWVRRAVFPLTVCSGLNLWFFYYLAIEIFFFFFFLWLRTKLLFFLDFLKGQGYLFWIKLVNWA